MIKFFYKLFYKKQIQQALEYYNNSVGSTKRFASEADIHGLSKLNQYDPDNFLSLDLRRGQMYFDAHYMTNAEIDYSLDLYKELFINTDRQNPELRNMMLYLLCNYSTEDNYSHPMHFDNELVSIAPVIKEIYTFVNEVDVNNISKDDIATFRSIRFKILNFINCYKSTADIYKSTSVVHTYLKDVISVYDRMIREKIY